MRSSQQAPRPAGTPGPRARVSGTGDSVTRNAGLCRSTRRSDGPAWSPPMGHSSVCGWHRRARVQPAWLDHEPAAAVSRAVIEPAPVAGRDRRARGHARLVLRGVLRCRGAAVTPLRGRACPAGGPGAARHRPAGPGGVAGLAALPRHGACGRRHRADERAAAEPYQTAPAGQGGPADRDLPAQPGGGGDPRLTAGGTAVPGLRWVGPAGPGDMGPAGGSGGAGMAAAMALPDGAGRNPAACAAAVAESVQVPAGLAGHGLYGLAKPDLLRNALLAPDAVPGQGSGPHARGHAARVDEHR